jgi:predicted phosphodiesterase
VPESIPYWLAAKVADDLNTISCRKLAVLGNHDCEDISRLEHYPIYFVHHMARVTYVRESGLALAAPDGTEIVLVNHDNGDYAEDIAAVAQRSFSSSATCRVLCVHGPIIPPSLRNMYPAPFVENKAVKAEDLAGLADYILYGDIHDPHGIYTIGSTTFCNPGSIGRNTRRELDSARPVCVGFLDTATRQIQLAELEDVVPAVDAFKTIDIMEEREHNEHIDKFVTTLGHTEFAVLTPEVVDSKIDETNELTEAEKQIAKQVVKTVVRE